MKLMSWTCRNCRAAWRTAQRGRKLSKMPRVRLSSGSKPRKMMVWKFPSRAGGSFLRNPMMPTSRRTLLPRKPQKMLSVWWALAGFAVILTILFLCKIGWMVLLVSTMLAVLCSIAAPFEEKRRLLKIAAQRREDSICTFARSFDCHLIDTRIIRATYEELKNYYSTDTSGFPIRDTDSFEKGLKVDGGDLDDIAIEIARRAQRSMENAKQNPLYGKVKTVSNLVLF
jgi:hypothetical protein